MGRPRIFDGLSDRALVVPALVSAFAIVWAWTAVLAGGPMGGSGGALRLGFHHGAYCLGCCWALMLVLVVAGSMGLGWVVFVAAVVFAEKLLPRGAAFGRALGIALVIAGILLAARPDLVPFVANDRM